jgi:hypothetical protein
MYLVTTTNGCPAGTYANTTYGCPAGTYANATDDCPAGTYAVTVTDCDPATGTGGGPSSCLAGYYKFTW